MFHIHYHEQLSPHSHRYSSACGRPFRSLHNIQKRIVDGRAAEPGAFPWQALILARERPNGEQRFGGGAILTSRWLLTASHLLLPRQKQFGPQKPLPPSGLDVFVGLHEIRKRSEAVRPVVESVHLHVGFDHRSYDNDIALLRLKTPIPFGSTIMPVCLPFGNKPSHVDVTVFGPASLVNTTVTTMAPKRSQTKSHPSMNFTSLMNDSNLSDHEENETEYEGPSTRRELSDDLSPGDMGVVSGWGSTWATLNSSWITSGTEFLQYVNLPVVNESTCRDGYRKNGRRNYRLTKNMFCAGYAHGGPDTCLGDSGGAYVTQATGFDGSPQWVVQGLVSWGWPGECGRKGVFGVYSRVANYVSWIKDQIRPFGEVDSLPYNDPS
uniref:coagulation factor IX-like n=1 Tax=Myxine glutinosa TaxID=7769 RepID=UPI00358EC990